MGLKQPLQGWWKVGRSHAALARRPLIGSRHRRPVGQTPACRRPASAGAAARLRAPHRVAPAALSIAHAELSCEGEAAPVRSCGRMKAAQPIRARQRTVWCPNGLWDHGGRLPPPSCCHWLAAAAAAGQPAAPWPGGKAAQGRAASPPACGGDTPSCSSGCCRRHSCRSSSVHCQCATPDTATLLR